MQRQDYKDEFVAQAGLRKIIIPDVDNKHWQKLFNFLKKTETDLRFFIDDVEQVLPSSLEAVFEDNQHYYLLSLILDGVVLNCDFERIDTIVFRFDPGLITDVTKATLLFRVMSTFARRLGKVALMSEENKETSPIFRYEHGKGLIYLKLNKKFELYE